MKSQANISNHKMLLWELLFQLRELHHWTRKKYILLINILKRFLQLSTEQV